MSFSTKLPEPTDSEQIKQDALIESIQKRMDGSSISFKDYMEHCLYTPNLGYYSSDIPKIGKNGDFTTAPEISSLFSKSLSRQIQQVLETEGVMDILEFGAGSGKMACDIMLELENLDSLPKCYYILEISPSLQKQQQAYIKKNCSHLNSHFKWIDALPKNKMKIVVIANELIDAMPVSRILIDERQTIREYYVTYEKGNFCYETKAIENKDLNNISNTLCEKYQLQGPYSTEINLSLKPWLNHLYTHIEKGCIIIIDYGYPEHTYYHPQRTDGTLMCYYKHQSHNNPLILKGLQDITASVDFTRLGNDARRSGFDIAGYTNQAFFLMNNGLLEYLEQIPLDSIEYFNQAQAVKKLTLSSEMGETIKVMGLIKGISTPLDGFKNYNQVANLQLDDTI